MLRIVRIWPEAALRNAECPCGFRVLVGMRDYRSCSAPSSAPTSNARTLCGVAIGLMRLTHLGAT